jgi:hypothetical protein
MLYRARLPSSIPLTCRLRGKFYAYCTAVTVQRRRCLSTIGISVDTAVRFFDHRSVLYSEHK